MPDRQSVKRFMFERTYSFAVLLVGILLVGNLIKNPQFVEPDQIAGTLAIAAPFVIAAVASTPAILSGGGGIDLSVGPLLGFVNVILVVRLIPHGLDDPYYAVPILLAIGALVGLVNGLLVAVVRLQPIVATLGTYLILVGWSLREMPEPIGEAPSWLVDFGDSFGPVPGALIMMLIPVVLWILLQRTAYYRALMCVGGDERASFSAGINVTVVRIGAYVIGGIFAAVAGLALTALIRSGDPTIGPQYTLAAIAAVALGGTSLAGGRGGIIGSILGAFAIFLIQNFLGAIGVAYYWNQVAYGAILLGALILNAIVVTRSRRRTTSAEEAPEVAGTLA
jgi:ribose transport system permease protein